MSTARDIIKGSLRLLGVIASGETPSADEQSDGLLSLNDMLDSWSNENLLIYNKVEEEFALVPSQQSYTMGPLGDFNTTRPQRIEKAFVKVNANFETPIKLVGLDEWSKITVKSTSSSIPIKLYPDGGYPFTTLNFWPVPSVTNSVVLWSWKAFTTFASATTSVSLPPGYSKALRYNLALELAPEYGKDPSQAVITGAMESRENIKRMNVTPQLMGVDSALIRTGHGSFNWKTGE